MTDLKDMSADQLIEKYREEAHAEYLYDWHSDMCPQIHRELLRRLKLGEEAENWKASSELTYADFLEQFKQRMEAEKQIAELRKQLAQEIEDNRLAQGEMKRAVDAARKATGHEDIERELNDDHKDARCPKCGDTHCGLYFSAIGSVGCAVTCQNCKHTFRMDYNMKNFTQFFNGSSADATKRANESKRSDSRSGPGDDRDCPVHGDVRGE